MVVIGGYYAMGIGGQGPSGGDTSGKEVDPDGDGLETSYELEIGTDPYNPDTDGDGLLDGAEVDSYRTDPLDSDTDNDDLDDGSEIAASLDPLNPDTDGDGIKDGSDKLPKQINAKVTGKENNVYVVEDTGEYIIIYTMGKVDGIDLIKLTKNFYQEVGDEYDFLTVYTTEGWPLGSTTQFHLSVQNNVEGIGGPENIFDQTSLYGSDGKLKGINVLGPINQYEIPVLDQWMAWASAILHETGHQWACFVGQDFRGDHQNVLEIRQQGIHYYRGLQSPYDVGCAMNSDHWVEEGDHYKRKNKMEGHPMYHPFTLYFMGVMSKDEVSEYPVFNAGVVGENFDPDYAEFYKMVSVDDIIAAEGLREPTSPNAQRDFKMAFVLLTGKEREPTPEELEKIDYIADRMPIIWNEATQERSSLN